MSRIGIKKPVNSLPIFNRSRKTRKFKFKLAFKITVVVFAVASSIYLTLLSGIFELKNIQIEGASKTDTENFKQSVYNDVNKPWFGRNLLLLDTKELESKLVEKNFVFTAVYVEKRLPNTLHIRIHERETKLVLKTGGTLYLIGDDGTVSEKVDQLPHDIIILEDLANVPVEVGKKPLGKGFINFVATVDQGLKAISLTPIRYSIPDTTFELNVELDKLYVVIFDTSLQAEDQLEKFRLVHAYMGRKKIRPKEYVNLTVENRVYYK